MCLKSHKKLVIKTASRDIKVKKRMKLFLDEYNSLYLRSEIKNADGIKYELNKVYRARYMYNYIKKLKIVKRFGKYEVNEGFHSWSINKSGFSNVDAVIPKGSKYIVYNGQYVSDKIKFIGLHGEIYVKPITWRNLC